MFNVYELGVCGSTISATRPVPVADDAIYPYPYPTRAENFYPYPTRPAGIPVPVAYPYNYRTISVKPMARGGTAHVTHPNVICLKFDCECRQDDISRLLGGKLTSSDVEKST